MTFFTRRLLNIKFIASSAFNSTWAHQPQHISAFLQAAEPMFEEITEAPQKNNIEQIINHKTNHTTSQDLCNDIFS